MMAERGLNVTHCNARSARDVWAIERLARFLRNAKPDLVHAFLFHANVACQLALPLAGLSHRRLICEIQTVEIERKWHLVVGGMLHRLAACYVGNSRSVTDHLHAQAHMARSRIRCIPGGVDVEAIQNAAPARRGDLNIPDGVSIIMWVGRMDPVKGLDELIEAFGFVVQSPSMASGRPTTRVERLVLVGDGPYAGRVQSLIRDHGLSDMVMTLGRRHDVFSLLKSADVFVLPSYTEGLPNALLEAMAAGVPVVTTDVPGCRDLVHHRETGLIVPPRDARALARAIESTLRQKSQARHMAQNARRRVLDEFTFDRCVDRYLAVYDEIGI